MPKLALDYKAILAEQLHRFCGFRSELPERHRALIDVRRFGPGERFVFEPYTQDMYERIQTWIHERGIFAAEQARSGRYTEAVLRLEAAG